MARAAGQPAGTIEVVPATPERWHDVVAVLGGDGDRGCWCQYWRKSSAEYRRLGPGGGRRGLRQQVDDSIAPGVIAYLDGEPAGWCGLWPRARMERLVRSRTIPVVADDDPWSIVCFMVRVGFRRKGVARALLDGALDYARSAGARVVEGYPIDPEGHRVDVAFAYVGFVPMFEAAGFRRVVDTDSRSAGRQRVLMRRELGR